MPPSGMASLSKRILQTAPQSCLCIFPMMGAHSLIQESLCHPLGSSAWGLNLQFQRLSQRLHQLPGAQDCLQGLGQWALRL